MNVNVISATPYPMSVISQVAGVCYGKTNIDPKRVQRCFSAGHLSVFEHASATFLLEGPSRSCMAQLTRHRLASFCVESQRYCKYDLEGEWYVVPPAFEEPDFMGDFTLRSWYQTKMENDAKAYRSAIENGTRPEDARFLLPEAAKTRIAVTMNCRELFHVFDMRMDKAAQWEVRDLVGKMHDEVRGRSPEWEQIIDMYDAAVER